MLASPASTRPTETTAALCFFLVLLGFGTPNIGRAQDEKVATDGPQRATTAADYQRTIDRIESEQGAYGADLSEALLSQALALQAQGKHGESVALFKRGAHLTRVNNGLYSIQQIPMLEGEITSHMKTGKYLLAQERQRYLYRVQTRGELSSEAMINAHLQQARWQYDAFKLGLPPEGYIRLMQMWDFYRLARNGVIAREGGQSPKLLPPLLGMLQTQYLISSYDWHDRYDWYDWYEKDDTATNQAQARQGLHRFNAYRSQSYSKGNAVIASIEAIERNYRPDSAAAPDALVMQGDWHLWHGQREAAWQAYRDALTELAQQNDAQVKIDAVFAEPVALPDIAGLRPLAATTTPEQGNILLEFGVSARGKVFDLQRLDDNKEFDGQANRLMRALRKTKFRPQFASGEPVETQSIVKAFNIQ